GEVTPTAPGFLSPVPHTATALDINWDSNTPGNGFTGVDYYLARWKGGFTFDPGTYRFTVGSDDGVRVFFDGASKVNQWIPRKYTEDSFEVTFPVRINIFIQVDYMERAGAARVNFGWTKL
ncbi:MAG: PA14 domain-containing protein, partial [Patescibacteria group bacterium]